MTTLAELLAADPVLADEKADPALKQEIVRGYVAEAEAMRRAEAEARTAAAAAEQARLTHQLEVDRSRDAARQWRHSTPLAIALTGLITLAANFGFQYFEKEQDLSHLLSQSEFEADTRALEERLRANHSTELETLRAELAETSARNDALRKASSEERQFQYTLVRELLDSDMPRVRRAEELLFLARIEVLTALNTDELEKIATATIQKETGTTEVPEATLPGSFSNRSSLSLATVERLTSVLGPSGLECDPPMVRVAPPFEMVLDWNPGQRVTVVNVHRAAAPFLERAFALLKERKLEDHVRRFAGGYVARRMRGSTRPSKHAWGIAVDFDMSKNGPRADSTQKTMPDEVAETFEEAGFLSMGLSADREWGHFELSDEALTEIEEGGYVPHTCPEE